MDLISLQPLWHEMDIRNQAHVSLARAKAAEISRHLGFSQGKQGDIVLSVSEMAQNHVKHHTISGRIRFFGQRSSMGSIMSVSSLDMGPGIPHIKMALKDGITSANGLGSGLGCIRRIADRFAICSGKLGEFPCPDLLGLEAESVTLVSAEFFQGKRLELQAPVDFSYLIRPAKGESYCGDGVFFNSEPEVLAMVVIDALGHGREAADAVSRAVECLEMMPVNTNPVDMLLEAGRGLSRSRGISAQAVRVDIANRFIEVAAVGNVSQYLYIDGRARKISGHPGVLGPVISRSSISKETFHGINSVLGLIFTDGLGEVPKLKFQQSETSISALLWVQYLFSCCSRGEISTDDATLLVWKWQE